MSYSKKYEITNGQQDPRYKSKNITTNNITETSVDWTSRKDTKDNNISKL